MISEAHRQGVHGGSKNFNITGRYNPDIIPWYQRILKDLYKDEAMQNKQTWLDVGCGHGEFIEAVQKYCREIKVRGSEPNTHKQESARKRGLDVGYFEIDSHHEKYDVVSLLNVYSHIPNPPVFLRSLKQIIKPGGELILETGDQADLAARDQPRPLYLPDRLSFPSEKIVVGILEQMGFEIVCVRKYPFMRLTFLTVAKELVKVFLHQYQSRIIYFFKNPRTDMFIRARLKD